MSESASPANCNSVTPYLVLDGAGAEISFLQTVLNATVRELIDAGEGKVRHAELMIGNSMVMLADSVGDYHACPAMLYVYVADCDATFKAALEAGARSLQEPTDQAYGDRSAGFMTERGMKWWVATRR